MVFDTGTAFVALSVFCMATFAFVAYERTVLRYGSPSSLIVSLIARSGIDLAVRRTVPNVGRSASYKPFRARLLLPKSRSRTTIAAGPLRAATAADVGPQCPTPPIADTNSDASRRLKMAGHVTRLVSLVGADAARAAKTEQLHRAAGQQIDLAAYAIQNLITELSAVMPSLAPVAATAAAPRASPSRLALAA